MKPDQNLALNLKGTGHMTPKGDYMAMCPAHNDKSPSLSIRWTGKKMLFNCYARCHFKDIAEGIRAIGIDPNTGNEIGKRINFKQNKKEETIIIEKIKGTQCLWEGWEIKADNEHKNASVRYDYKDINGNLQMLVYLYKKSRIGRKDEKQFIPVTPWLDENGSQELRSQAVESPRTVFGIETIQKTDDLVIIVEGESCTLSLRDFLDQKIPVVSAYGGKTSTMDFKSLENRNIVVIIDEDTPGHEYGLNLQKNNPENIAVISAPWSKKIPIPEGWDIKDAIEGKENSSPLTKCSFITHIKNEIQKQKEERDRFLKLLEKNFLIGVSDSNLLNQIDDNLRSLSFDTMDGVTIIPQEDCLLLCSDRATHRSLGRLFVSDTKSSNRYVIYLSDNILENIRKSKIKKTDIKEWMLNKIKQLDNSSWILEKFIKKLSILS